MYIVVAFTGRQWVSEKNESSWRKRRGRRAGSYSYTGKQNEADGSGEQKSDIHREDDDERRERGKEIV